MSNNKRIDLHTHTSASDGVLRPSELVNKAMEEGLSAIAITDHDTVKGIAEAVEASDKIGLELIPGIELTCREGYREYHILGYFIDYKSEKLIESLKSIRSWKVKETMSIKDYMAMITEAGGLPVLAHPAEYGLSNADLEAIIKELKSYGLVGVEVMHPSTPSHLEEVLKDIASRYNLIVTGGSDFHTDMHRSYTLGIMNVDYEVLSQLKAARLSL